MDTQNTIPPVKDSKPIKKKMSNWKLFFIFIFLLFNFIYLASDILIGKF